MNRYLNRLGICAFVGGLSLSVAFAAGGKSLFPNMAKVSDDTNNKKDTTETAIPESSIVDEVIWVVGDAPILKSDVEMARMQGQTEGVVWNGDPDCLIPEQLAVQKLFLHQAELDSIEVSESEIASGVERQIDDWIQAIGSREKLEEYRNQSLTQIREGMHDEYKNMLLTQKMKSKLAEDIKVSPADVRNYFRELPEDSIPFVPTEVEVEIIERSPVIKTEEINRVKDQLRSFTERVTNGETTFATLARLYSEDPGTARRGGELDYVGRGLLDPAFATVAFNLTDPKKISKIVESEFGYHIIQLVDKRGDKVKVRHILLKPKVSQDEIDKSLSQLDSISDDIRNGKFTFEDGATFISDDKDTRNNRGLMSNLTEDGATSRFQMKDLPQDVAKVVDTLQVGQVSRAFRMTNEKGQTVCAVVRLKNRIEGHQASMTEDFQRLRDVVVGKRREEKIEKWIQDKINSTYVRISPDWRNCEFRYKGWVK